MNFCSAYRCVNCAMRLSLHRTHGRLDALLLSLTPLTSTMHAALCCECKPCTFTRRQVVSNVLTAVAAEAEGHAGARAEGVPPQGGLPQHRQDTAHDGPRRACGTHAADTLKACARLRSSLLVSPILRRSIRLLPTRGHASMPAACMRISRCSLMALCLDVREADG